MKILEQLLPQLPNAQLVGALAGPIERVHTDTRSLRAGDLFVALKGDSFDANTFLTQAQAAGAVGAIAHQGLADAGLGGVEVPDTLEALGQLAQRWRQQWSGPLIAVTGSNGKTTVTQMVAAILHAEVGDAALATQGNFNNHIGVPLTLLRLRDTHRLAVVELGMNHPGEIAYIAGLAQPTVALVNNAQREHQEFMATIEAVAIENGQVIRALSDGGVAVFPSDDAHTAVWRGLAGAREQLTFSDRDPAAEVQAGQADWIDGAWSVDIRTPKGAFNCRLHIAGRHNVRNALAATACALAAGVSLEKIAQGLTQFEPVGGRSRASEIMWASGPMTLVDDTYNANPDSVIAAIDVLAELPGPRRLVLGDMGEVGDEGLAFHLEVLRHAQARGIDNVDVAGAWMAQAVAALQTEGAEAPRLWGDVDALAAQICATAAEYRSVLVKGSRFMRMERVVNALQAASARLAQQQPKKDASHAA
ncbi:UDP-N-acetylmuramoyl-tripeptide--D-alanyl-D-alanine ligase [Hydrogenophaga sp. PAMC20947]|uniref:UDP-N-acetylmuramoyl-tripeptide--D-alanyl-D- alanine ligase n=1 Tax=Hydrogenophaga sp. PAMC20947 TaxID=2565558 RepID=UPI00109DD6C4|nr:UDP-N-acetylmuramoyl-tripeptide--D-alanyl-D-alanine ligase [Hydrogenophaga sp. PAMC20947]QCB48181.1 UDP-N-acetylmuramoyl-tripeptide--D-alanyl-D-alanine ligase [Hydrogenophaga sp. PAMC20947]